MFKWFQVARRVSQLEDEMLRLTRVVEGRDLDWQDMRARVKRLLDRTEKAARRVVQSEEVADTEELPSEGAGIVPGATSLTGFLTPRQKILNAQILRKRLKNGGVQ